MKEFVRWGILAPGKIAHSFAKDLSLVEGGKLVAVASRNQERAKEFADLYGAEHAFGSYVEMLRSDQVDVIYIATPHTGHFEWAVKAMEHGKHVLCEKPMGINMFQVKKMIEAAEKNKVFLMEAMWSRFNPAIQKAKELVDDGKIGSVAYLHADFAFYALDRDEEGRLLNPDLAGGSVLDIGIYPIFLAYLILGMPKEIRAVSNFYRTGAEVQTSMIFNYPGAQAILYSGLTSASEMKAEISGSKGSIYLDPRWHEAHGLTFKGSETQERYELPTTGKGYAHEIAEVHACLQKGKLQSALWGHQQSIDLIQLMDRVRNQAGIVFPFEQ
ncbi:MAG: Gfo/Idh/MocA family oxidoreductase [Flavobacteriaceae bacterium]